MSGRIRWDSFETNLGQVYAASSEHGLTRLTWLVGGDRDFESDLARQHAGAKIVRDPGSHAGIERQLRAFLDGEQDGIDAQLDLSCLSVFERAVLEEARRIPYGGTITYAELARRIGRPGAARAVGNALRHNPLPLIFPCHRIIRADGTPGGYGGPTGTAEKVRLLRLEADNV